MGNRLNFHKSCLCGILKMCVFGVRDKPPQRQSFTCGAVGLEAGVLGVILVLTLSRTCSVTFPSLSCEFLHV